MNHLELINKRIGIIKEKDFRLAENEEFPDFYNWLVIYASKDLNLQFFSDRSMISAAFCPTYVKENEIKEYWLDIELLIAYIERRKVYELTRDLRSAEEQLRLLDLKINKYFEKIITLFNSEKIDHIKKEIKIISNNTFNTFVNELSNKSNK